MKKVILINGFSVVFSGLYKDDIAQVDYVDVAQNEVHLKLLPRVDYTRPRGALRVQQVRINRYNKLRKFV